MTALAKPAAIDATFTLQLSSVTPADVLREWFDGAPKGARAIYASGVMLPREAESVKLARALEEAGAAILTQERDQADPRRWRWTITKMGSGPASPCVGAGTARGGTLPRAVDRGDLRKLLSELRSRAERGAVCPSLNEAARLLGLPPGERGRQKARYLFRRLEERGDIAIESRGPGAPRRITIRAAGRAHGRSTAV